MIVDLLGLEPAVCFLSVSTPRVLAPVFLFLPPLYCFYLIKSTPVVFMRSVFGLTALLSTPSGRPGYCSSSAAYPPGRCPRHSSHLLDCVPSTSRRCDLAAFITHGLETHDSKERPSIYLYSRFLSFFFLSRCSQDFSFAISSDFRILFPGGSHSLSVGLLATNSLCFFLLLLFSSESVFISPEFLKDFFCPTYFLPFCCCCC